MCETSFLLQLSGYKYAHCYFFNGAKVYTLYINSKFLTHFFTYIFYPLRNQRQISLNVGFVPCIKIPTL